MKRLLAVCALVFVIAGCSREPDARPALSTAIPPPDDAVVHRSLFMDRAFFDRAFKDESAQETQSAVIAGIIPHHLLASHLIARFFLGFGEATPSVVVVIGPNHFNNGNGPMLTSRGEWSTPYGVLEPAVDVINELTTSGAVKIDERVFEREHSISAEVSFIRRTFPQTRFVPIVLKNSVPMDDAKKLADILNETLPDDALVIVSADFSHEVTPEIADRQAEANMAILNSRDEVKVPDLVVDSKPAVATLLAYIRQRGVKNSVLLESSNAARVTDEPTMTDVTSYLTYYFTAER